MLNRISPKIMKEYYSKRGGKKDKDEDEDEESKKDKDTRDNQKDDQGEDNKAKEGKLVDDE